MPSKSTLKPEAGISSAMKSTVRKPLKLADSRNNKMTASKVDLGRAAASPQSNIGRKSAEKGCFKGDWASAPAPVVSDRASAALGGVMRRAILLFASLSLCGCAKSVYLLADGRMPASDPVVNQQFEMDRTVCQGELQKANLSGSMRDWGAISRANAVGQVGQGCMAEKGYVLVPEDQVVAKQQELAAVAAEKGRREAVATAFAAPTPPSPHKTAAVKPKPQSAPSPN
jgi:hypothetical protein